jgi:hypothetical protein
MKGMIMFTADGCDAAFYQTRTPKSPKPLQWGRLINLKPHKARLALAMIGLVISAATSLVFPAVISTVVDSVLVAAI